MTGHSDRKVGAVLGMSRRQVLASGVTAAASALVSACSSGGGTTASITPAITQSQTAVQSVATVQAAASDVKVALLLPMSRQGEAGKVATDLKQAGELALFELNKPGLTIVTKDTGAGPESAAAAAAQALAEGAEVIIGPLFANDVTAVAPLARQANVPMVSFSTDRKVAGNGVYLLSFLVDDEVARIVGYAVRMGKRQIAGLVPQTPYGDLVEQALRKSAVANAVEIAAIERFPVDPNGMGEPVKRLSASFAAATSAGKPVDALLLPGAQDTLPTIAPMLTFFDLPLTGVQVLGTAGWDYPNIGREPVLAGGWFAAPDPAGWRDFSKRYVTTYSTQPTRVASLGYDAVSLALALSANPAGQRFTPGNLLRPSGFAGTDGLVRLRADGTSERGLAVLQVQKAAVVILEPAPGAFVVAQN
jgi:branched-chain amino acid transport system substrate-binding protein